MRTDSLSIKFLTLALVEEIISGFKALKVEKCGATQCTGDAQIAMFKKAFGEDYVPMGTGRVVEVPVFQLVHQACQG
jgi:metal-dependent hydrolase (beta-lactamase superfamily II)